MVVDWVPWLAGINIIGSLYFYYTNGLFLGNRTDLLSLPALVRLGVLIVTGVLLLPPLQLTGIVISRYCSEFVFLGLSLYLSQRIFHLDHRWRTLLGLLATAVAFATIGRFLTLDQAAAEITVKAALWVIFIGLGWWIVDGARHSQRAGPILNS
jgi:hypothetical protein